MPGTFVQLKKISVSAILFEPVEPGLYVNTNVQSLNLSPQIYDIPTVSIDLTPFSLKTTLIGRKQYAE